MEPAFIPRSYQQRTAGQRGGDEDDEYGLCSLKGSLGPPDPRTHISPSSPSVCEAKGLYGRQTLHCIMLFAPFMSGKMTRVDLIVSQVSIPGGKHGSMTHFVICLRSGIEESFAFLCQPAHTLKANTCRFTGAITNL